MNFRRGSITLVALTPLLTATRCAWCRGEAWVHRRQPLPTALGLRELSPVTRSGRFGGVYVLQPAGKNQARAVRWLAVSPAPGAGLAAVDHQRPPPGGGADARPAGSGGYLENLLERLLVMEPEDPDTMNAH